MAAISGRPRHGKNPTKTWRGTGGANRDGVGAVPARLGSAASLLVVRLIAQLRTDRGRDHEGRGCPRSRRCSAYRDKQGGRWRRGRPAAAGQGAGEPSGGCVGLCKRSFWRGWPTDSSDGRRMRRPGSRSVHPQRTSSESGALKVLRRLGGKLKGTPQKPRKKRSRQSSGV